MATFYSLPSAANAVPVVQVDANGATLGTRSVGTDRSINQPTGPVGAATSFTYNSATVNLLGTVPANSSRNSIEIMNTSGAIIVLVIDDGSATAGTVTILPIVPGTAQFIQGGEWNSTQEQGRIRIFGTTGTFVAVREN